MCDAGSTNIYRATYPDGVVVDRFYAPEVTSEQTQSTQPVCEEWRDAQGNSMEPGDPAKYPKSRLIDYRKINPEFYGG